ncbi:MAG TPA: type II CAAX endopeptidase family protein [Candidatus Acidoferrales bacterium]|nr:type II CAAX endopeptidase family protein [Candidatus Acidoferrales bacterium]
MSSESEAASAPLAPAKPAILSVILGLFIAFSWPLILRIPGVSNHDITNIHDDAVDVLLKWVVTAILCVVAFSIQHKRPSEFGIRALRWRDSLVALGCVVIAFMLSGAASRVVAMPSSLSSVQKLAAVPVSLRIAVVLTAAICEEFMYRGFGIEELAFMTGNRWLAGFLSWFLFTFSHAGLYGLSPALIIPGLVGAVLTALYLWRRNLVSCILMHAIMDGIFLLLVPAIAGAR